MREHAGRGGEPDGPLERLVRDERGVSTAMTYALSLLVVTLLTSTLLAGGTTLVENEQQQAITTELGVVGERLATDLVVADRLARATDGGEVRVRADLPAVVGQTRYEVEVVDVGPPGGRYDLTFRTTAPRVKRTVPVRTTTDIETGTVRGGELVVSYAPAAGRLEVDRA